MPLILKETVEAVSLDLHEQRSEIICEQVAERVCAP